MNLTNIITGICSLLFFMIGADKFLTFLEPPCSLESSISPMLWKVFGVLQLATGFLIWIPRFRKYVAGFFVIFMLVFTILHLANDTYDIGGSAGMTFLLGLLVWNPWFMDGKKN